MTAATKRKPNKKAQVYIGKVFGVYGYTKLRFTKFIGKKKYKNVRLKVTVEIL